MWLNLGLSLLLLGLVATTIYFAVNVTKRGSWDEYAIKVAKATDQELWSQCGCNQPFNAAVVPDALTLEKKRLFLQDLWHREWTEKQSTLCYSEIA